jgi:hypothetical protein
MAPLHTNSLHALPDPVVVARRIEAFTRSHGRALWPLTLLPALSLLMTAGPSGCEALLQGLPRALSSVLRPQFFFCFSFGATAVAPLGYGMAAEWVAGRAPSLRRALLELRDTWPRVVALAAAVALSLSTAVTVALLPVALSPVAGGRLPWDATALSLLPGVVLVACAARWAYTATTATILVARGERVLPALARARDLSPGFLYYARANPRMGWETKLALLGCILLLPAAAALGLPYSHGANIAIIVVFVGAHPAQLVRSAFVLLACEARLAPAEPNADTALAA